MCAREREERDVRERGRSGMCASMPWRKREENGGTQIKATFTI
jgi:hypothetical protein